jgi:tRNA threonylcarbamoyladenosine biosynthesis protein TsaE
MPATADFEMALELADLAATADLARRLAGLARPGDVIALHGELGTGKTSFARTFIQARGGTDEVPSPTFTLVQEYPLPDGAVCHFDLYRLERPEDAYELGIEDAFADAISLIEWPERLGALIPEDRLDVSLAFAEAEGRRRVRLQGSASWQGRLATLDLARPR